MTMMRTPLTMPVLMDRGPEIAPEVEIVSMLRSGFHRCTYADVGRRSRQLANALRRLGVEKGDRVATFAWNSYRHLEIYYAVPCMGAVLHTLNIRLFPEQLEYIINHAEDRVICVDEELLPLLQALRGKMPTVRHFIVMSDTGRFSTPLEPAHDYDRLLDAESAELAWPELDENDPMGLCYTSGTTGNPKGVMYTHRSNYLHTITASIADVSGVTMDDTMMAIVPMFHANAWGWPFIGCMIGVKQVFPGPMMDGASICRLIQDEGVTVAAGVPTIWLGVMSVIESDPGKFDLSSLRAVLCGGASPPRAMIDWFEANLGVEFVQGWGMTETSPLGSLSRLKPKMSGWSRDRILDVKAKAGLVSPGLQVRLVNEKGEDVPRDGASMGRLLIRGPWIASEYYRDPSPERFPDGWLDTGDVATMDAEGYIAIVDRSKDLVKSGGEWISSVDLENAIMAIPGVAEAAVIAVHHPRWQERPLACIVLKHGAGLTREEVLEHLSKQFARWWLPDDVVFVDGLPKTSVGKFDKKVLRGRFEDYELPK